MSGLKYDFMSYPSLVSIADYSKEQMLHILELAAGFESNPNQNILQGKVAATLFLNHPPAPVSVSKLPSTGSEDA